MLLFVSKVEAALVFMSLLRKSEALGHSLVGDRTIDRREHVEQERQDSCACG